MNHRRPLLVACAALALVSAFALTPPATAADAPSTADAMTAHRLEQWARQSLSGRAQPHPAQVRQASILLEQALELDPTPADRWLLLAEARQLAADRAGLRQALRGYLKRRADDDVAQLQLIELYGKAQQTADKLAAFYERIATGPKARRFSPALRSRVAFRAALVALEQGDPDRYAKMLGLALELDPTNKDAAAESFRVLAASPDASLDEQASALLTLFQADPADPAAHLTLANSLMDFGLYDQAAGWFQSADRLHRAAGLPSPPPMLRNWALCLWGGGRIDQALSLIRAAQAGPAEAPDGPGEAPEGEADGEGDAAAPDSPDPRQVDPFARATLRTLLPHALMLHQSGQTEKVETVFDALADRFAEVNERGGDVARTRAARVWAHLFCDYEIETASNMLATMTSGSDEGSSELATLGGWLAMRRGELDKAEAALAERADADPRAALGLCFVLNRRMAEAEGEAAAGLRRRVQRRLRSVQQATSGDLLGLIAASELRRMGLEPAPTESAKAMAATLAEIPAELRDIASNPRQFVLLSAEPPDGAFQLGEGATVDVTIRNVSRWPLSMGPGGTIPTRLMAIPSVRAGADQGPDLRPHVVDMNRRLRLEPDESVTVPVRVDSGDLGLFLAGNPTLPMRINLAMLLNPRLNARGGFAPGVLGSVTHARHLRREGGPIGPQAIDNAVARLRDAEPAASMRAGARLAWAADAWAGHEEPEVAEAADRALAALVEGVEQMSAVERAWLLTCLAPEPSVEGRFDDLVRVLSRSDAAVVQIALLASRVNAADSPLLNAALRREAGDPARAFAQARRTALELREESGEGD